MGLKKRIKKACYGHVEPVLDQYEAERHLENCLHLMEPRLYADFATKACSKVAAVVVEYFGGDEAAIYKELIPCLADFANALKRYATAFNRFQQVLGQAPDVAWNQGAAIGEWAGDLVGGVAGLLVGAGSAYVVGQAIDREVQAEGKKFQKAFKTMLNAYDEAMYSLLGRVIELVD